MAWIDAIPTGEEFMITQSRRRELTGLMGQMPSRLGYQPTSGKRAPCANGSRRWTNWRGTRWRGGIWVGPRTGRRR